jgi:membrane-associated phospholipid phosphatase
MSILENTIRLKPARQICALPLFLTPENKYVSGVTMFAIATILYLTSNHFHFFTPQYLPMTWVDQAVPFIPLTLWIYISEYVFFAAIYLTCRDLVNANKYLYSFFALQTVSVAIFWMWPTTFPRHLFPLPDNLDPLTHFAFNTLRQSDTPASCCPSLHVSSVYLSSFIFLDDQKKKFPFFFVWGTLIALSTLTTKQHYLIDVVAGLIMAIVFYYVFHRWIPYKAATELGQKKK